MKMLFDYTRRIPQGHLIASETSHVRELSEMHVVQRRASQWLGFTGRQVRVCHRRVLVSSGSAYISIRMPMSAAIEIIASAQLANISRKPDAGSRGRCSSAGLGPALYAAKRPADVGAPRSLPQAGSST
jgi:hypothetical protein